MPGSQQNIAFSEDDQCYLLPLSVVLILWQISVYDAISNLSMPQYVASRVTCMWFGVVKIDQFSVLKQCVCKRMGTSLLSPVTLLCLFPNAPSSMLQLISVERVGGSASTWLLCAPLSHSANVCSVIRGRSMQGLIRVLRNITLRTDDKCIWMWIVRTQLNLMVARSMKWAILLKPKAFHCVTFILTTLQRCSGPPAEITAVFDEKMWRPRL